MKILITGWAGFIGSNIAKKAIEKWHSVIAFDNLCREGTEENVKILKEVSYNHPIIKWDYIINPYKLVRWDIRSDADIDKLVKNEDFDAIIHMAANPGVPWSTMYPKYDFEQNALGTLNMLEVARKLNIPFIYASTNKTFDCSLNDIPETEGEKRYDWDLTGLEIKGITEKGVDHHFNTTSPEGSQHSNYGVSKLTGDLYCQDYFRTYGVKTVINRMSCIYGLMQKGCEDQWWVDYFVRKIAFGDWKLNIYGNGKQVRDLLFGEDVAELYITELENIDKCAGEVFVIGGGRENSMSLIEVIEEIEKQSGKKSELKFDKPRPADHNIFYCSTEKAERILGWKPKISISEGIAKMINQYNFSK